MADAAALVPGTTEQSSLASPPRSQARLPRAVALAASASAAAFTQLDGGDGVTVSLGSGTLTVDGLLLWFVVLSNVAASACAFALARLEARLAWTSARRWRIARSGALGFAVCSVVTSTALTAAEAAERLLRPALSNSPLEGLVAGLELVTIGVVMAIVPWSAFALARWAARRQLAGLLADFVANESTWFLALMAGLYPWLMSSLPRDLGLGARSVHFFASTSLGGLLGGLVFSCILSALQRPRSSRISPLIVVLPEPNASKTLGDIAAWIARGWRNGPVTVVAHPAAAPRMRGTHLRLARRAGSLDPLFPAVAEDVERYASALPPASAWESLPHRECFPRPGAWDETLRLLAPDAARVLVLHDGGHGVDSRDDPESRALLSKVARRVPPDQVVFVTPRVSEAKSFPQWTRRVALDRDVPRRTRQLVLGHLPSAALGHTLHQIVVAHEAADTSLAEAVVAQLAGRRDAADRLIDARSVRIPRGWALRLYESLGGYRDVLAGFVRPRPTPMVQNEDRSVFVILERAATAPSRELHEEDRDALLTYGKAIARLHTNVVVVRVGQPFRAGEKSRFGARRHAGWIGEGGNVALDIEHVAARLLRNQTEALEEVVSNPEPPMPEVRERAPARPHRQRRNLIYISYRRNDAAAQAGRLAAELTRHFGDKRVFFDTASVWAGEGFPQRIQKGLELARVVLVVIGPNWLRVADEFGQRRIDLPTDWVRQEIERALGSDGMTVIPVLVDGAYMPSQAALPETLSQLASRVAMRLEHGQFEMHVGRLAEWLRELGVEKQESPRVFINYSHDSAQHRARVLELAQRLRRDGVNAWVDQFDDPPDEGWLRWMQQQLTTAGSVLVVCTENYRRRLEGDLVPGEGPGVAWEGAQIHRLIYEDDARNRRYIPVLLEGAGSEDVPLALRATTHYRLPEDYDTLYRRLTNSPAVAPISLGSTRTVEAGQDPELLALREEQRRLASAGRDTAELDDRILVRRRQLRDSDDVGEGTRLNDRFELIDRVGSGGFASVWRAYDHRDARVVAVKILHRQHADDRTRRERFLRGARQMSALHHPNVVRVLEESGRDGKVIYFVMEFLPGGDLFRRVRSGAWRPDSTLPTLLDLAEALRAVHALDFVHRDVKPANVLFDAHDRALLTDFDLARAADSTGGTRTGALGTFLYAAPEALADASRADARADVYSLSMVGVFLLLGKDLPAEAIRDSTALIRGLDASPALKRLLLKGCAWNPSERFQSMEELIAALRAVQGPAEAELNDDGRPRTAQ